MAESGVPASGYPAEEGAPTVIDAYYSLLAAGEHFKNLPPEKQHFTKVDLDEALRILADDHSKTISPAARYHALRQLVQPLDSEGLAHKRGLPGFEESLVPGRVQRYQDYAATFADTNQQEALVAHIHETEGVVDPHRLEDLLSPAAARVVLDDRRVCTADGVTAHTISGTSENTLRLYSQFESDAGFATLVGWLDPTSWPARGPLLFKSVTVVVPPGRTDVPEKGGKGWRGTYLEKVELIGRPLETYLDCSYWERGEFAALTYELHESVGNELTVDRGYLSITPSPNGGGHQVRALKLVSFTDGDEAVYEDIMCPIWTDCVQQAAENAIDPGPAGRAPSPSTPPGTLDPAELGRRWTECMTDATSAYTNFAVDVAQELVAGGYDMDDYRRHGMWLWTNLARDWSRAWVGTLEVAEQVARLDRGDPSGRPGPAPPLTTTVIVGTVDVKSNITLADLVGIGGNTSTIPASALEASPREVEAGVAVTAAGTPGTEVTVTARITGVPPGLYRGELYAGPRTEPVLIYVSGAIGSAGAAV